MTKIPVGATIALAYRFVFGNFLTLVSIFWLPWLILSAGGWLLMHRYMALPTAMAFHNPPQFGPMLAMLLPFYVMMVILLCMQMVGVTQQVLGLRQGSPYYYFSLGRPLWRLIGAFLLVFLLIIAGYLAVLLCSIILTFFANFAHLPRPVPIILGGLAFLASFCAYIYALVRLTFLLIPVVVAENRIGLKRSWQLGRGNFWRMFAILLSILIPAMVFEIIFIFGFLFHGLPPAVALHAAPAQAAAAQAAIATWNANMIQRVTGYWYFTYPLFAVFTVVFYGLSAGAQSFAYRARIADETEAGLL